MAASSRAGGMSTSVKVLLLAIAIVIAGGLYTAGWFYAADALKTNVMKAMGEQSTGVSGDCADMEFRGYPFRIGLFCSKVNIDDSVNGISASFGGLRSAAQVYAPGHIVWELDGPAVVRSADGMVVSAEWGSFQSSLVTRGSGIDRTSAVVETLKASFAPNGPDRVIDATAARAELHLRQTNGDLTAALLVNDLVLAPKDIPLALPPMAISAGARLMGKAGLIDGSNPGLYGTSGELRQGRLDAGQGRVITMSGPFSVNGTGDISGRIRLEIEQLDVWRDTLKQLMPHMASTFDTASSLLKALAGKGGKPAVDVTIRDGVVSLGGFLTLGKLPPI